MDAGLRQGTVRVPISARRGRIGKPSTKRGERWSRARSRTACRTTRRAREAAAGAAVVQHGARQPHGIGAHHRARTRGAPGRHLPGVRGQPGAWDGRGHDHGRHRRAARRGAEHSAHQDRSRKRDPTTHAGHRHEHRQQHACWATGECPRPRHRVSATERDDRLERRRIIPLPASLPPSPGYFLGAE
jgi:hypothetical protein